MIVVARLAVACSRGEVRRFNQHWPASLLNAANNAALQHCPGAAAPSNYLREARLATQHHGRQLRIR